jgi:hypothetical protein
VNRAAKSRQSLLAGAVVVALVVVAIGAGARGSARINVSGGRDIVVVAAVVGALMLLGWLVATANRRELRKQLPVALAIIGALAVLMTAAVLLVNHFGSHNAPPRRSEPMPPIDFPRAASAASSAGHHGAALSSVPVVGGSLIVVLLVVGVVLALLARRRRARIDEIDEIDDEAAARGAVYAAADAGADAMRDVLDPRAAIIACYAAMERVLADAGIRRLVAETPSDLLARAIELNLAPDAARRLTALFLEARYSTHPLADADRDAAREALAQLRTPEADSSVGESSTGSAAAGARVPNG